MTTSVKVTACCAESVEVHIDITSEHNETEEYYDLQVGE